MLISIYLLITVATVTSWFIDSSNMNLAAHALALGVARGFFTVFIFYIAFIWLYFRLRKIWQKRYAAEILVIGIVVVLSVVGKMLISYFTEVGSLTFVDVPRDAWDNTAKFYYAVYQALGGISFEGLAEYEMYETWRTMIYAGGSVLAGAVAISILTFSISYEIYSFFAWFSFRGRSRAKIYIFTAVTEDAVTLAHSIDEYNKKLKKEQTFAKRLDDEISIASCNKGWDKVRYLTYAEAKAKLSGNGKNRIPDVVVSVYRAARAVVSLFAYLPLRCRAFFRFFRRNKHIIVFLRTEGEEGFDAKNALHADIMHSGFLFMSYNPGKKNKSIARFLHINSDNDLPVRIIALREALGECGEDDPHKPVYQNMINQLEKEYRERLRRDEMGEVRIFALDWEKDKTSVNDSIVTEDIARVAMETFGRGDVLQRVKRRDLVKEVEKRQYAVADKIVKKLDRLVLRCDKRTLGEIKRSLPTDREKAFSMIRKLTANEKIFNIVAEIAEREYLGIENYIKKAMGYLFFTETVINYHYLLSEEIDLSNVDMRFDNEIAKFRDKECVAGKRVDFLAIAGNEAYDNIGGRKSSGYAPFYKNFKRHFRLNALNEANMAAMLYVKAKGELVRSCPDLYRDEVEGEEYKAMVIGFGLNGQQTLKAAYVFSAAGKFAQQDGLFIPDGSDWLTLLRKSPLADYTTQPFNADVYDKNATDLGGLFKMKNPSFYVELPSDRGRTVNEALSEDIKPKRKKNLYPYAPVTVRLYQESAYSDSILRMLDRNLGEEKSDYDLIVIALGDDDSNVSIANALLEDYKHEFEPIGKKQNGKRQVFAVNLRDKLNYDRINWCRKDEDDYPGLKVVIYGAAEDMYSYENVVDQTAAKIWNSGYAAIQGDNGESDNGEKLINDILYVLKGEQKVTAGSYVDRILQEPEDVMNMEIRWMNAASNRMYNMTSSKYASYFSPFAAEYCRIVEANYTGRKVVDLKDVSLETLIMIGAAEHDRWVRFVLSNGYIKADLKSKHAKAHSDIVPYNQLSSQPNDMINVLNALATEQTRNALDARG